MTYLAALLAVDEHDGTQHLTDYLATIASKHEGNRKAMAAEAGVSPSSLYHYIKLTRAKPLLAAAAIRRPATLHAVAEALCPKGCSQSWKDIARRFTVDAEADGSVTLRTAVYDEAFVGRTLGEALEKAAMYLRAVS